MMQKISKGKAIILLVFFPSFLCTNTFKNNTVQLVVRASTVTTIQGRDEDANSKEKPTLKKATDELLETISSLDYNIDFSSSSIFIRPPLLGDPIW